MRTHCRTWVAVLGAGMLCAATAVSAATPPDTPSALVQSLRQAMTYPVAAHESPAEAVWVADIADRLSDLKAPELSEPARRARFLHQVYTTALRTHLPPNLVLAVIDVESGFHRFAVSSAGARGYMQVMPFWGDLLRPAVNAPLDLFDPETNLLMGCVILRGYLKASGNDWTTALARYNGSNGRPGYPWRVLRALNTRWSPG